MTNIEILELFLTAGKLKTTKRTGWVQVGIQNPESVSDHSYRVILMALLLGTKEKINTKKIIQMAIIHDIGEAQIGDLVTYGPRKNTTPEDKHKLEKQSINELFSKIKDGKRLIKLWNEFEKNKTKEAKLLHDIDRLEIIFTALEYEKAGNSKQKLDEFWEYTPAKLQTRIGKELYQELLLKRKQIQN
jgi:putative hydrolase of HD superfamily